MTEYLQPIIDRLQMVQRGADDWRLPKGTVCPKCKKTEGDNPGFSVSSKGWHDHHTGDGGALEPLARKLGILQSSRNGGEDLHAHIYNQSTLENPDKELIVSYLSNRGINLKPEEEETLWGH